MRLACSRREPDLEAHLMTAAGILPVVLQRSELVHLTVLCLLATAGVTPALVQATANGGSPESVAAEGLKLGIIVEKVAENSEGKRAGIQEGDILLRWSRSDAQGETQSPFDLATIEIEQSPLGTVTLEGLRGVEKKIWTLGPDTWGIQARPTFSESLLAIYSEGSDLARAGKRAQAEGSWRTPAGQAESLLAKPWLRPRGFFRVAKCQEKARQGQACDAAPAQVHQRPAPAAPDAHTQLLQA